MIQHLLVGIPIISRKIWNYGPTYIELLMKTITTVPKSERSQLFLIVKEEYLTEFSMYLPLFHYLTG